MYEIKKSKIMKFLIQKINKKVVHDFSLTLLESIKYKNWYNNSKDYKSKFINTVCDESNNLNDINFADSYYHKKYIPIGSVEFVSQYLYHFYGLIPKPLNVPLDLFNYTCRMIWNGTEKSSKSLTRNELFVKSNDKIKGFTEIIKSEAILPEGNYQFSEIIEIESEWRAFVYQGKLVGLQNYSGDFTKFPDVYLIKEMINDYKSAPIAYTLDVGVTSVQRVNNSRFNNLGRFNSQNNTFVIECHDFFSCGLYGFADHKILPNMFHDWFNEYINKQ